MPIDIPSLIDAAGGQIVGKVRLQKLVYLLEQLGVDTGYSFIYHQYGPYSEELADDVEDDVVFRRVAEEQKRRSDGVPFVVYRSLDHDRKDFGQGVRGITAALQAMQRQSATVLELAATIHWLAFIEKVQNWRTELVRRKGVKTEQGRMEVALKLLRDLDIAPA